MSFLVILLLLWLIFFSQLDFMQSETHRPQHMGTAYFVALIPNTWVLSVWVEQHWVYLKLSIMEEVGKVKKKNAPAGIRTHDLAVQDRLAGPSGHPRRSGRFGRAVGVGCDLRRRLVPVAAIYAKRH